jgi:hypothetical protein
MCFSAGASFASGIVISAIGIATLGKVSKPAQKLFAVIPLLFDLQQFTEGVLWITLRSSGGYEGLQNAATYIFLITALIIWPVLLPLSMWFMEKVKTRKKILAVLIVAGSISSLFYGFCLIFYNVTPQIQSFHIQYIDNFPWPLVSIIFIFYFASTVAPLFVSSIRRAWLFGILITISYIVTRIFYAQYVTSVWCFFAALLSVVIYWILRGSRTDTSQAPTESQP